MALTTGQNDTSGKAITSFVSGQASAVQPAYTMRLANGIRNPNSPDCIDISVPLPRDFGINSESEWGTLGKDMMGGFLDSFLGGSSGGQGILQNLSQAYHGASKMTGMQSKSANAVSQFPLWLGNSPITFQIPFQFNAMSDSKKEVVDPMRQLIELTCPDKDGEWLKAPGPRIKLSNKGNFYQDAKYNLTLYLGTFMTIPGIIVTNVNPVYNSRFDANGYPISARAEVSFRTLIAPSKQEVLGWFSGAGNANPVQDLLSATNKIIPASAKSWLAKGKGLF